MGWGYSSTMHNCARIPRITGFEFMRKHYKEVVPIRGRVQECKPLGANRRHNWFTVAEKTNCFMSEDEPLGRIEMSYVCRLGNKDLVEFYRDGSIVVRDTTWHSPTSMGFLTHSLREFGRIQSTDGGKWYFINNADKAYLLRSTDDGLRLVKDENGFYTPTNPIQEFTYSAKRKELNKLRRSYKDFMDYARTMLCMDERVTMDTAEALGFKDRALTHDNHWAGRNASDNRKKYFSYLDKAKANNDLDLMYSLAQYTAGCFGGYRYELKGHGCSPTEFDRGFADILKYQFADDVFEAKPVEIGEMFFNRNQKYVKSN